MFVPRLSRCTHREQIDASETGLDLTVGNHPEVELHFSIKLNHPWGLTAENLIMMCQELSRKFLSLCQLGETSAHTSGAPECAFLDCFLKIFH